MISTIITWFRGTAGWGDLSRHRLHASRYEDLCM